MNTDDPVTLLRGVGPTTAAAFARLDIATVADLLLHLPSRYQEPHAVRPARRGGDRPVLPRARRDRQGGSRVRRSPQPHRDVHRRRRLPHHAAVPLLGASAGTASPGPLGPLLRRSARGSRGSGDGASGIPHVLRRARTARTDAHAGVSRCERAHEPADPRLDRARRSDAGAVLGGSVLPGETIPALDQALLFLHRPPAEAGEEAFRDARARIARDELLAHTILMRQRQALRARHAAGALPRGRGLGREFAERPGLLADRRAAARRDGGAERPRTGAADAAAAAGRRRLGQDRRRRLRRHIRAAEQGRQTAIMAPTEILAEQHHETFSTWLSPLGIDVALVTGRMTAKERQVRQDALTPRGHAGRRGHARAHPVVGGVRGPRSSRSSTSSTASACTSA